MPLFTLVLTGEFESEEIAYLFHDHSFSPPGSSVEQIDLLVPWKSLFPSTKRS